MTLERIEHKVFASEAPLDEMGQFGSALATTKLNTKDVAEIQALPAYTKGWGSAIISENNYPAMEEMNGVLNVMSYHTGYLYQEGIPTYSATQEYSVTSWVKDLAGKNIYKSKKDNNIGNDLNDSEWFERVDFGENSLKTNQITNCITEIPQRIKLELADGVLTLKAGSQVIVPNGFEADGTTPKFDYITINENLDVFQNATTSTKQAFLFVDADGKLWLMRSELCFSGETKPTVDNAWLVWHDTKHNVVNFYQSLTDHNTVTTTLSLPFAIATPKGDGTYNFTSIDQVFNGMGYIGSTIFVDKGVKGLIPNGRNEDGTLNNIEFVSDKIYMRTYDPNTTSSSREDIIFCPYNPDFPYFTGSATYRNYVTTTGFLYSENRKMILKGFSIGYMSRTNDKITEFILKTPFRAIDYSDKSEVSSWGMPSGKKISLNGGASGSRYVAPANGWFKYHIQSTTTQGNFLLLVNEKNGVAMQSWAMNTHWDLQLTIPVKTGDTITVHYNNANYVNSAEFIYAQGEV